MSEEYRYGVRDELVPAVTRPVQAKTALKRRKKGSPYFFRGRVQIAPTIGVAVAEAFKFMRFVSTAQKIQVCIFTDASFSTHTGDGGYALAYNALGLGSDFSSDYIQVAKGWPAVGVNDNNECEGLAIAQSLREAIRELTIIEQRVLARCADTSGAGERVEVSVCIFSDSQTVLKWIKQGKFPKEMKGTGHAIILLSEELSERFRGHRSKLKVNLVVHFIPGHNPRFPQHQVADQLSRKCQVTGQPLLRVADTYVHWNAADSVYEEVQASKQYRGERVTRWLDREYPQWKEAEKIDEAQPEEQQPVAEDQPEIQQSHQQEWDAQVQQYLEQSAGYWEQLSQWQEWQRSHGHQTGQWSWDHNANQWVWQWDN